MTLLPSGEPLPPCENTLCLMEETWVSNQSRSPRVTEMCKPQPHFTLVYRQTQNRRTSLALWRLRPVVVILWKPRLTLQTCYLCHRMLHLEFKLFELSVFSLSWMGAGRHKSPGVLLERCTWQKHSKLTHLSDTGMLIFQFNSYSIHSRLTIFFALFPYLIQKHLQFGSHNRVQTSLYLSVSQR